MEEDPHELQWPVLFDLHRLILVAGGERAGKSWLSALYGATRTPYGSLFWIQAATYELARPEFEYWTQHLLKMGAIRSKKDISAPKVGKATARTKTGQLIETRTADDVKKLAAVAPDGILMVEAAQQSYEAFLRALGRVAEKRGWLLLSGTFEESLGWYADRFTEWRNPNNLDGGVSYSIPSWANRHIYPGGRSDPEILRLEALYSTVDGLFEERLGAVPVPPAWLIFREFRWGVHVRKEAEYERGKPVYLAVDPSSGGNPYAVLACQFHPDPRKGWSERELGVHPDPIDYCFVVDEIYAQGKIGEEVIDEAKTRWWWPAVRGGAIDHEAPDERKRWLKYGKVTLQSTPVKQHVGIRRLKSFLHYERADAPQAPGSNPSPTNKLRGRGRGLISKHPHLQIHPRVRSLPFEFSKFRRDPPRDEDHSLKKNPPTDSHNHSLKALWYLLVARYGEVKASREASIRYTYQRRLSARPRPDPTPANPSSTQDTIEAARSALRTQ